MIKYHVFVAGPLDVNSYLVYNESESDAVVIDAGGGCKEITDFARKRGLNVNAVLLTHGHFDHTAGAHEYQAAGIKVGISTPDEYMLSVHRDNLAKYLGFHFTPVSADFTFRGGDELTFGSLKFKVILTPGHTLGSCCFLCDNVCFSGDTLFLESVGRTDFPTGSHRELLNSIRQKLFTMPEDTVVCPGHNEPTTIGHEKKFNPYAAEEL